MSGVMFRRELANITGTALSYGVGLLLFAALALALWPTVRADTAEFAQLINQVPEALRRALGIGDVLTFTGYLGARLLNFFWPLVVSVFVIMAGAAVVAQEIERGTVDLWLSAPLRRWRLLAAKLAALFTVIALLAAATMMTLALVAPLVGETLSIGGALAAMVMLFAYGAAVGSYAALCSALASERGRAAGAATGITFVAYVLWLLAGLSEQWAWLRYGSFFTAFTPEPALASGRVPLTEAAVLLLIAVLASAGALVAFERRRTI